MLPMRLSVREILSENACRRIHEGFLLENNSVSRLVPLLMKFQIIHARVCLYMQGIYSNSTDPSQKFDT